jgi:hypothetical protein
MPKYSIPAHNNDPKRSSKGRMIQLFRLIEESQGPTTATNLLADGNREHKWGIGDRQLARDLSVLKDEGLIEAVPDPENRGRRCWLACRRDDVPRAVLSLLVVITERWGVPLDLLPDMSEEASALVNSARDRARIAANVDPQLRSVARFYMLDNEPVRHPVGKRLQRVSNALGSGKCVSVRFRAESPLSCLEPHAIVRARGRYWTIFTDPRQPGKPLVIPADELAFTGEVDSPVSTRFNAADFIANGFFKFIDTQADVQARLAPAVAADRLHTRTAQAA